MKERFKRLNEKIDDLEKAESLEEIIIASWKIFRANLKNTERQALLISIIDNKKADFYRKELLTRKDEVYMELITNFINNRDDDIISKTCKKTNLAWWEIKEILLTVKNPSKIDIVLAKYVMTKCPKEYTKEKELSHRIREAFIKVMLVENSGVSTFLEFEKKYKASRIEIAQAYDTIKYYKNDVYKSLRFPLKFNEYKSKMVTSAFTEYINREKTVAKEEIKKGISKESVASSRSRTLLTFYEETGIPILLVKRYVRELGNDNEMFFSLTYDKQKSILLEYKKKELLKIEPVINELFNIASNSYKTSLDYYNFYKLRYSTNEFVELLSSLQLHNASSMLKKYHEKHKTAFACLDSKETAMFAKKGTMFFENEFVTFTQNEFTNVTKELEEERLPLAKGLITQKIKEKQASKKEAKVIVKKNNVC